MYEVEAHVGIPFRPMAGTYSQWISSFFANDPHLLVPSLQEALDTCHAENEFLRARYPDVDLYVSGLLLLHT
jgi:hypothetical protein